MVRYSSIVTVIVLVNICHGGVLKLDVEPGGRIVGGEDVDIKEVPYQISLSMKGFGHMCGGAIISETLVLTAAHCVQGSSQKMQIRAGSTYTEEGGQAVVVESKRFHEKFNYATMDYDIAMLKLEKPLVFGPNVAAIKIVNKNQSWENGKDAVVTGWGVIVEGGTTAYSLQKVVVPLISQEECSKAYEDFQPLTDRMLCAGFKEGGKDACQGDSGGPLTIEGELAGVVSWGYGCARPNYPGVYTRLSELTDWIEKTAKEL